MLRKQNSRDGGKEVEETISLLIPKDIKADCPVPGDGAPSSSSSSKRATAAPPPKRIWVRVAVIASYCVIWTLFLILVHYGNADDKAGAGKEELATLCSTIFIIIVEIIKALANGLLYLNEAQDPQHTPMGLVRTLVSAEMRLLMVKYMPIAILYAIYNNLMFLNLRSNNPITYQVVSSSRIILTTVVWQMSFKGETILPAKKLAIFVIFLGILSKNMSAAGEGDTNAAEEGGTTSYEYLGKTMLMLLQMSCSVLASIYNETLLKNEKFGSQFLQNISLTFTSMGLNALVGAAEYIRLERRGIEINLWDIASKKLATPASIAIVMTLAAVGIMSSAMLRYENSITKGVTSAMVTVQATIIEYFFFDHVFVTLEMLGIFFVCSGTVLYFVGASSLLTDYSLLCVRCGGGKKHNKLRTAFIVAALFTSMGPLFYISQYVNDTTVLKGGDDMHLTASTPNDVDVFRKKSNETAMVNTTEPK